MAFKLKSTLSAGSCSSSFQLRFIRKNQEPVGSTELKHVTGALMLIRQFYQIACQLTLVRDIFIHAQMLVCVHNVLDIKNSS